MQFITGATGHWQLLNTILPAITSYVILRTMPAGSAYLVLLTGFLAYSAAPGALAAAERSIDILIAGFTALIVNLFASGKDKKQCAERSWA